MGGELGKVGLVGPGAVGGFYGGMLANAGVDLQFLFRSSFDLVSERGLHLIHHADEGRKETVKPLKAYRDASEIGPCDWVIVAVKSTANDELGPTLEPLVDDQTSLLTLQNGMGNVENLARLFGRERIIMAGLCFTCINRTEA
ncbi:MAG: 2-dehydropantoate 2-reductase N-terminal domain-containing protein, partial [Verrucomicrobiota bacterium]|nr:2-dehydropantoate 2-reductase N-terminal domain-containing protein [Verrucomicrobiota bacterium]